MSAVLRASQILAAVSILTLAFASRPAAAQNWINFNNETATRMVNGTGETYNIAGDTDEKDYAAGDVDHDGDEDLVLVRKQPFSTQGKRSNYLFINENGVLTNETSRYAPQLLDLTNDRDVALVDLNDDGWLDLVTATTLPTAGDPRSIRWPRIYINLGADGAGAWLGFYFDAAAQDAGTGRLPVWRLPGSSTIADPLFCSVSYGDVDGDGDTDLFFVDYSADTSFPSYPDLKNKLVINDGNGFFTDVTDARVPAVMLGNGFGTRGAIVDLDGDGDKDLIASDTCSASPQTLRIAFNNGSGTFSSTLNVFSGTAPYDFDIGDLNNDGRLDVLLGSDPMDTYGLNAGNNLQGHPLFNAFAYANVQPSTIQGFSGVNTYASDLNRDGFLDAVITTMDVDLGGGTAYRMSIYRNIGDTPNVTLSGAGDPFASLGVMGVFDVAILHINNDACLDMVVGMTTGNKLFIQTGCTPPDTTAPNIMLAIPASGTIDRFQDRDGTGTLEGILQVTATFSEPVRDAATHAALTPSSFAIALTTSLVGLSPPVVTAVSAGAGNAYTLTLDRPITPGAWNTVTANVEDLAGNHIGTHGIDLGHLPGDMNGNFGTTAQDVLALVAEVNLCSPDATCNNPALLALFDVNRNGQLTGQDVLRLVQLLNGLNTQNPWNGVTLPPQPYSVWEPSGRKGDESNYWRAEELKGG